MKQLINNKNKPTLWIIALLAVMLGLVSLVQQLNEKNRSGIVIEWATASEIDTVGYNILRSEKPDGTFIQVNSSIIPASLDPFAGGEYRYVDPSAKRGTNYYYWLEAISTNGLSERHGPLEAKASGNSVFGVTSSIVLIIFGCGLIAYRFIINRRSLIKIAQTSS